MGRGREYRNGRGRDSSSDRERERDRMCNKQINIDREY